MLPYLYSSRIMIISIPMLSFIIYQLHIMDIKTYYISIKICISVKLQ